MKANEELSQNRFVEENLGDEVDTHPTTHSPTTTVPKVFGPLAHHAYVPVSSIAPTDCWTLPGTHVHQLLGTSFCIEFQND